MSRGRRKCRDLTRSRWVLLACLLCGCFMIDSYPDEDAYVSEGGFIVDLAAAVKLHARGALILDTRKKADHAKQHVAGSHHADWAHFSEPKDPNRGRLLADEAELTRRLRAMGVSAKKPVVVLGDAAKGWGEDGRIVWMLRTLGHADAVLLDGGFTAAAGTLPLSSEATPAGKGDFVIKRTARWDITAAQLRALINGPDRARAVLVDTREKREYDGATPYGESRGGHVPGAVHLHYRQLLNPAGRLRPRATVRDLLKKAGIPSNKQVVVYCTGGVRSGWLVMLLADLGYKDARNYAGSMWEWAARPAKDYPLTRK